MTLEPRKKKKNGRIRSKRVWIVAGVFAIVIMLIIGKLLLFGIGTVVLDSFLSEGDVNISSDDAIPSIEKALGADLPESASNLNYYYTAWQDWFMRIRVDMPPQDALQYISQTGVECLQGQPLQEGVNDMTSVAGDPEWWQPSSATSYSGMEQCNHNNNIFWSMMIDQSDPDLWILYFEAFSI